MSDEQTVLGQVGGNGMNAGIPLPPSATIETSDEPPRTLWMGDLDPSFDEVTIQEIWQQLGRRVFVKLIRAKKNLLIPCSSTAATAETPATAENVAREGSPSSNEGDGGLENAHKININGVSFIDPATTPLHHAGYCFVEFETQQDAQFALSLNSTPLPNFLSKSTNLPTNPTGQRNFRLNWASGATLQSSIPSRPEFSLFVGDLSPTATEADLLSLFQQKFRSVKTVRVMTDPITGASRCFGFVRFGNEEERRRALVEMNGVWCQGRCLRVAYATPRNNMMWHVQAQQQQSSQQQHQATPLLVKTANNMMTSNQGGLGGASNMLPMSMSQKSSMLPMSSATGLNLPDFSSSQAYTTDPNNTTVFIGGLTPKINEAQLQALFSPFGSIVTVKIPQGKNCGFVKYENRIDAEAAIQGMQGFIVGGNPIRLSWGRSTVGNGPSGPANASSNASHHHNNRKNEKPSEFQQIASHQYITQQHYGNEYQYMPMRHTASESTKVAPPLDRYHNVSTPLVMPSQQMFTPVRQQMWNNDSQWSNVPVEVYSETPVPNQRNMGPMLPHQYQRLQQSQNPMNMGPGSLGGNFNMNIAPNAGGISLPNARGNSNDVPPIHPSVLR